MTARLTDWSRSSRSSRLWRDLLALALVTLLAGFGPTATRVIAGAVLVFYLLGHYVRHAAFGPRGLDPWVAWLFDTVLSIASTLLVGLILDRFPSGLNRTSWLVALVVLAAVTALIGSMRDGRDVPGPSTRPARGATRSHSPRAPRSILSVVLVLVSMALAGTGVALAHAGAAHQDSSSHFTQLWVLPDGNATINIGVTNHEGSRLVYRLRVMDGDSVLTDRLIPVADGAAFRVPLALPPGVSGSGVLAQLFVGSDPSPYRQVAIPLQLALTKPSSPS